ncbi:hypothetical protein DC31_13065 [Microbacterium sp. CH12i]|uniref:DEAD/DEAH box helicase family protein n=1 Tax=Microbacterium sp. CH12i TaxID=1479651 RepID=UPI000460FFC1|nr:DEAD/DEAH box helicase family protein [Microbacterium sp. CH12i]KDA06184.1 hypothetical protein DC31_13065 [Microbacterium sp. CH12i]
MTDLLGTAVEITDDYGPTRELRVPGVGSGRVVAAVSELISRGRVRLLVGTRGLLGEGWDCPAVNTLIDLTAVATSSATQQLRGRTLRLDPAWPEKVAHNWSVACLIPADVALDDAAEPRRLRRKHSYLWGLSADDDALIISGLGNALPAAAETALDRVLGKDPTATIDEINRITESWLPTRAQTRIDWRIGLPYVSGERDVVSVRRTQRTAPLFRTAPAIATGAITRFGFGTLGIGTLTMMLSEWGIIEIMPVAGFGVAAAGGLAIAAISAVPVWTRALRSHTRPAETYRAAAVAIARTLYESRKIGPFDESAITVHNETGDAGGIRIELAGSEADRRCIADALQELFSPVQNPRFLLRIDRGATRGFGSMAQLADRLSPGRTLLPVPRMIGRRRADAEQFSEHWGRAVGRCTLHELRGFEGAALLRVARSTQSHIHPTEPRARIWG